MCAVEIGLLNLYPLCKYIQAYSLWSLLPDKVLSMWPSSVTAYRPRRQQTEPRAAGSCESLKVILLWKIKVALIPKPLQCSHGPGSESHIGSCQTDFFPGQGLSSECIVPTCPLISLLNMLHVTETLRFSVSIAPNSLQVLWGLLSLVVPACEHC